MKLIGQYPSQLSAFHYRELQRIIDYSKTVGDFEGGKVVGTSALTSIKSQSDSMSEVTAATSGQRITAESLNYPLSLLAARFDSLQLEHEDFMTRMRNYLSVVDKDSRLIDSLISLGELEYWVSRQNRLTGADKFYWDFAASQGLVKAEPYYTDPDHPGVPYPEDLGNVLTACMASSGGSFEGLVPGSSIKSIAPINLGWSYTSDGEAESLTGVDWARLSLLEPKIKKTQAAPVVTQLLPISATTSWHNYLGIISDPDATNLPIYVRIVFLPRRKSAVKLAGDVKTHLSNKLLKENLVANDGLKAYEEGVDFSVDTSGNLVWANHMLSIQVEIFFTEQYPAYQCSINETVWSPAVMLDPEDPYPDDSTPLVASQVVDGRFPITDEAGNPMGFHLVKLQQPLHEYTLLVETAKSAVLSTPPTKADADGVNAILTVEFDKPSYMNGLALTPFTSYPVHIISVRAEGMTEFDGEEVYSDSLLLDKATTIRFNRRLVKKLTLHLHQSNYTVKDHHKDPENKQRQDAYAVLQSVLPISVQQRHVYQPTLVTGYQYELGIKSIAGQDWQTTITSKKPNFFVTGPFRVSGTADSLILGTDHQGQISFYLLAQEKLLDGTTTPQTETELFPGTSIAFPAASPGSAEYTEFYVKMILREEFSTIRRFLLQVSHV